MGLEVEPSDLAEELLIEEYEEEQDDEDDDDDADPDTNRRDRN
jgi:hypothetical protein